MFLHAVFSNIPKKILFFFALFLSASSIEVTSATTQPSRYATPKEATQHQKKAAIPSSILQKSTIQKRIIQWSTILTIGLFYIYIIYKMIQYTQAHHLPTIQELHHIIPPYTINADPIKSIKALLNDEEQDQLDTHIKTMKEAVKKR